MLETTIKTFGVVRLADAWTITANGRRWGRYLYRVDAEEAALRLADKAVLGGERVNVLVQGIGGEMVRLQVA